MSTVFNDKREKSHLQEQKHQLAEEKSNSKNIKSSSYQKKNHITILHRSHFHRRMKKKQI